MRRLVLMLVACAATTIGAAILAGLLTVRIYWGYWIEPPPTDTTVAAIDSLDRYSEYAWDGSIQAGPVPLTDSARWANDGLGESPWGRLPAALASRGLRPSTADPVTPATFDAIKELITAEGYVVGKAQAHMAEGRRADGEPVVVAAVFGPELSNDHYPYYEVTATVEPDGRLRPVRFVHYRFDVAGLEGSAPYLVAVPTAALVVCLWGCAFVANMVRGGSRSRDVDSLTADRAWD